jgi:hypothetical protein
VLARHELNALYLERIAAETGLPLVTLPYLAEGVSGPDDVARLAERILAAPEGGVVP